MDNMVPCRFMLQLDFLVCYITTNVGHSNFIYVIFLNHII